jgi:hypothetical protein
VESRVERRLKDVLGRWLDVVYLQSGIDSRSGNESRLSLQTSDWLRPCGWRWKASLGGDASGGKRLGDGDGRREQRRERGSLDR